jgi:hypothetical protein
VIESTTDSISGDTDSSCFDLSNIPFDILVLICSYLDLRSLVRLSSTCHYFRQHCLDSLQFQSLNLQPYWNGLNDVAINEFFQYHCQQTRYLSLSWSKSIQLSSFERLLNVTCKHLTQLNLSSCDYLNGAYLKSLVNNCPQLQILNLDSCTSLSNMDFVSLNTLRFIRALSVYRTRIDFRTLLPLIDRNCEHIEHINIGKHHQ